MTGSTPPIDIILGDIRGGSVCLNGLRAIVKWISALVTPPPGLAWAC